MNITSSAARPEGASRWSRRFVLAHIAVQISMAIAPSRAITAQAAIRVNDDAQVNSAAQQLSGQGYQAIKDDLRRDIAIEYLARPDLTLIDIANLLGFSEPSTFHRAFKKWTGVAPGEYRHTRLQAAADGKAAMPSSPTLPGA